MNLLIQINRNVHIKNYYFYIIIMFNKMLFSIDILFTNIYEFNNIVFNYLSSINKIFVTSYIRIVCLVIVLKSVMKNNIL